MIDCTSNYPGRPMIVRWGFTSDSYVPRLVQAFTCKKFEHGRTVNEDLYWVPELGYTMEASSLYETEAAATEAARGAIHRKLAEYHEKLARLGA